jgi:hypothetical protein
MTEPEINNYDINIPGILDGYSEKIAYANSVNPEGKFTPTFITGDRLVTEGLDLKPYQKYLGEHLLPNQNLDYLRAEAQPWTEELTNAWFNLGGSIVGGIVENVGYIGALLTEWGDDRDYTNVVTEFGKGIKDVWRANIGGEIYRKNPNKVWDPMDSAWWISHGEGLAESVGEFLVTGYGVGALLGKGASAIATTMGRGATTQRVLSGAARVGTAATLAYTEGAMSGAQIYGEVYKEQYEKQLALLGNRTEAHKVAKHRAATAAATGVQLNTTINTLFNIGSVGPLFRSTNFLASNSVKAAGKKNAQNMLQATTRQAGDQMDDIIARTSNLQYQKTSAKAWLAGEAVKEGLEEQVNLFAEQSGKRIGAMTDKEFAESEYDSYLGYFNQFKQLSNFAKDVLTEEGALNFVLGAVGGIGQSGAMRYLAPVKVAERNEQTGEIIKNADGTPKMRWMRSRANEIFQERTAFNRMQNSVVGDLKRFKELSTKLNDLVTSTDNSISQEERERMIEDVRQELFDLEAYRSVRNGTSDYLKGTFEYIGTLDNTNPLSKSQKYIDKLENIKAKIEEELTKPDDQKDNDKLNLMVDTKDRLEAAMNNPEMTEAMYEGYAEKPNTDTHKKRSEIAIKEIDNYTKMYHDVMSKYNYGDEETSGLAETLFDLKLQVNTRKRRVDKNKEKIQRKKEELQKRFNSSFGAIDDALAEATSIQAEIESIEQEIEDINETMDDITLKKSPEQYNAYIDSLMKKYPTIVTEGKAQRKTKKQIERQLVEKEKYNIQQKEKNLSEKRSNLQSKKWELLKQSFNEQQLKNADLLALQIALKSEEELNKELEEYTKTMNIEIEKFNAQLDNDLLKYHKQITKDELDTQFLMDEYAKLASSKGRKEFVENSKAFFERIKELDQKRQAENKKAEEKDEAKKKGYFTIEETGDGKFGIFDKNDKLVETFDTEEEALARADELNKEIEEKKKKDEEKGNEDGDDKTDYDFKYRGNAQQQAKNLDFLNSLAEEGTEEQEESTEDSKADVEAIAELKRKQQEELNNAFNIEDNISFFESELDKVKKEISKKGLTKDRQLKLDAINSAIALLKNSKSYDQAFDKHVFEKNPIKLTKESTSEEIQKSDDWNKFQQYRQDLMDIPYLVRNEINAKYKEIFDALEGKPKSTLELDKQIQALEDERKEALYPTEQPAYFPDNKPWNQTLEGLYQYLQNLKQEAGNPGAGAKLVIDYGKVGELLFTSLNISFPVNNRYVTIENGKYKIESDNNVQLDLSGILKFANSISIIKDTGEKIEKWNREKINTQYDAQIAELKTQQKSGKLTETSIEADINSKGKSIISNINKITPAQRQQINNDIIALQTKYPEKDITTRIEGGNLIIEAGTFTESESQSEVDQEYQDFLDNDTVTDERIKSIGEKIATNRSNELTDFEKEILSDVDGKGTKLVNEYLIKRKETEDKKQQAKKSEYTVDEFIQKYLNYEFKDANGKTYKLEFLDKYLGFFRLAAANNTTIRVINDPKQKGEIFAQGNVITINVYHFNDKSRNLSIDDKILSELFVHEAIHTFIGSSLTTNNEFFNDMKGFVLSMGNSNNLIEALDNVGEDIKAQIREANKLEDSPEKVKKLNILKRALESVNYSKNSIFQKRKELDKAVSEGKLTPEAANRKAEELGLEEFIVLALSEPEFAFYLNTVPSDKAIEDGPSMSMWQVLKKILFKILDAVLNNKSRLAELNNMLDKHLAKTAKGLDLINIQKYFDLGFVLEKGIYTYKDDTETRNIVVLDMEGNNIIYTFPESLSDPKLRFVMSRSDFFDGNPQLNENYYLEEFKNELDNTEITSDNFEKQFERLKNQALYNELSIGSKAQIDEIIESKIAELESKIQNDNLKKYTDDINKTKKISEVEGTLNLASKSFGVDSDEFKLLSRTALSRIQELVKSIDSIENDNFIKFSKLTEFDDSFKHIFVELENLKVILNETIFSLIEENLSKSTNLKELESVRNKYLKGLEKLKQSFISKTNELKNKLGNDDYELQLIIGETYLDNIEERLERKFISRLSDDDVKNSSGVRYAQIISKNGKVRKNLYKIVGVTENGYLLANIVNKNVEEFEFNRVLDLSEKSAYYQGYSNKEEIFDENYAGSILFDSVEITNKEYVKNLIGSLLVNNILNHLRVPNTPYDVARAKAFIINNLPNDIININGKNIKKQLKDLLNKVSERNKKGNHVLNDEEVLKEIRKVIEALSKTEFFKLDISSVDGSQIFTSFLHNLTADQKGPNLGGKIRISVNNATRANKLKSRMKSTSKDNIDEKLRLGLIKANTTKKEAFENNEEVIGIHMWEDISVDYEINIAKSDEQPRWVKIGSARNPYAYKAIKRGTAGVDSSEVVKSPAHLYERYIKETSQDEKNKIVDEFNNLYSVNNQPVDNAGFEAIGKSWLKQKKLYDALSKKFKEQGDTSFTIEGDELNNIMSFSFTGGNFDFIKKPQDRKTLNEIAKEDNDNIELFKIETKDGVREFAVVDLISSKKVEKGLRVIFDTVDDKSIEGVSGSEFLNINQKQNYGRYWLVMRDVTGQLRFLWLKPRKAKSDDLNKFTASINEKITMYNDGKINKSELENFINDIYRKSIYLALPALPEINSINTFLNIEFNKDGKTLKKEKNKDGQDRYVFTLKVRPKTPELSPSPFIFINNLNLTDGASFEASLYENSQKVLEKMDTPFTAITGDNIRVSFEKFENMKKDEDIQKLITEVFEIPVYSNIYATHRLLTNINDDVTLEEEFEEDLEQEEEDLSLSNLTEQERELYYNLMQIDPYAANIINATKENNFITDAGNITPDNVSKKLGISKDQAKRSLQLLIDSGYLIKSGKYYKLNENFGVEEEFEAEEDITPEEDMNLSQIKTKLLTLESDAFLSGSVAGEIDEKEFEVLIDKLINNTNDDNLREQVVDLLLQYYQEGKYTEIVNELLDDTKFGKLTETIIDDPTLMRKKLMGCPK